ncbi:MAG: hypothetical protein M1831_005937 [Alyxoria varia]|nr:MAG: hypothetical protein M1831_005937 [Alyxoria varia]
MRIKAHLKKVFSHSSSSNSSSSSTQKRQSEPCLDHTTDPSVYKPGEAMPRPKYRAPVDKKHKEKLDSFSFMSTLRRSSQNSNISPGGTRISSRNNSYTEGMFDSPVKAKAFWKRRKSHDPGMVEENTQNDTDITNVGGFSRRHSRDTPSKHSEEEHVTKPHHPPPATRLPNGNHKNTGFAPDHKPFTEAEFDQALGRSKKHITLKKPNF